MGIRKKKFGWALIRGGSAQESPRRAHESSRRAQGEPRRAQESPASEHRKSAPSQGDPTPKEENGEKEKEGQVDHIALGDTTPPSSSDRTPQEENKRNNKWEEEVGGVGQTTQESLRSVQGSPRRASDAQNRPPGPE